MPKLYGLQEPLWRVSKDVFDLPAWGTPDSTDWSRLQARLAAWAQNIYGAQPFERMTLGIGEELGEMYEAREINDWKAYKDSVGDASVFGMQLCTAFRLDYGTLLTTTPHTVRPKPVNSLVLIRRFNQITLKTLQETRGLGMSGERWARSREFVAEAIADLAWTLEDRCTVIGAFKVDYFTAVMDTANEVTLRTRNLPAIKF